MKRFSLLSLVALVFAVVYACSESTTPPSSSSLMTPRDPSRNAFGDPPPPPVDAAVVICVDAGCAVVDGSYFSNGNVASAGAAAIFASAAVDGTCSFPGPSWLKFSNKHSSDVVLSANGQIKCSHLSPSGRGTIEVGDVVFHIDQVLLFDNQPTCAEFCGSFTATTNPAGGAEGFVFNRQFFNDAKCQIISEGGSFEGGSFDGAPVDCPGPGEGL